MSLGTTDSHFHIAWHIATRFVGVAVNLSLWSLEKGDLKTRINGKALFDVVTDG